MDAGERMDVSGDAFFGEVRRRHPDVDIVLLPQQPRPEQPPVTTPAADLPSVAAALDAEAEQLAAALAPGLDLVATAPRWVPGGVPGSVAREALLAVEGVDRVAATQALSGAERYLTDAGWRGIVPDHGMPRVLASRGGTDDDPVRREVQVVYVEGRGRYAVSLGWGPYVVGASAREAVVSGE